MGNNHLKTVSGNGLELDKIEIPTRSSPETVPKSTPNTERKSAFSSEPATSGKRHLLLILIVVIATLALLAAMAAYLKKQDLAVPFLSGKSTAVSNNYLRVGPISATMKNNEIIRLTIDIGCENNAIKKRLAEKDSRIRDEIVSVITAPDTETLFKKRQYDAIRAKIKERLKKIDSESIGEVYFAELLTY